MTASPSPNQHTPISFGDLWRIVRHRKGTIILYMVLFGVLACAGALLRPVRYEAEASFLDRGAQAGNIRNPGHYRRASRLNRGRRQSGYRRNIQV